MLLLGDNKKYEELTLNKDKALSPINKYKALSPLNIDNALPLGDSKKDKFLRKISKALSPGILW